MKFVGLMLLVLHASLVHAAGPSGLVPNGDFESEEHGALAAWMPFDTVPDRVPNNVHGVSSGYYEFVWDASSAGGGSGSLLVRSRGIRLPYPPGPVPPVLRGETLAYLISPKIPVRAGADYKLTYALKSAGMADPETKQPARFAFEFRFYQGNGKPGYGAHNGRVPNRTGKENDKQLATFDTPTHNEVLPAWRTFEATIQTPPDTTDLEIRVRTICTKPFQKFSVWVDDVRLVPVDASESAVAPGPESWRARSLPPATARGPATGDFEMLPPPVPYGSRLQRTMKLLATSTPERRHKVRILCYGQSIMAQPWWRVLQAELKQRFPHADLEMANLSLGGFMSNDLIHSAETDMIPFYPDLVLLHDYLRNGPDELDRLYGGLHHRTTAEMLTLTHHLAWTASEGMFTGNGRSQDKESDVINEIANRHGFEVVQIRDNWRHLLGVIHPGEPPRLAAQNYLQDQVHLSKRGELMMELITARHFEYHPEQPPTWLDRIRVYRPDGSRWPQTGDEYPSGGTVLRQPLKFEFIGNRVELIAAPVDGSPGSAKILIDGRTPSSIPEIYTATRTTLIPGSPWPMIKHVQPSGRPVAEDWTLTYTKVTPQTTADRRPHFELEFDLAGSVTGPDGSGSTRERFVSNSGRIVIEPEWFLPGGFWNSTGAKTPTPGTQVHWQTKPLGLDVWQPRASLDPAAEDRHVVAQNLANTKHMLEIIPTGDGPIALRALVVHQPDAP
jgi:hypothetical protein